MKRLIISIIFLSICFPAFSQSDNENMLKYWHYKNRLKYFVIPGIKQGESELITIRNCFIEWPNPLLLPDSNHWNCKNGDQTVTFGFYIGMLATEYKLLSNNNRTEEAFKTLTELNLALLQFENWMDKCENYYNGTPTIDGYFVRDNVPEDFLDANDSTTNGYTVNGERHLDLINKNLTVNNVWDNVNNTFKDLPPGHPGYTRYIDAGPYNRKDSMSQDMAIGLLKGLALVKRCCPNTQQGVKSEEIACNVISYIQNNPPHLPSPNDKHWNVYTPLGENCHGTRNSNGTFEEDNWSVRFSSYGFLRASKFFNNSCVNSDATCTLMQSFWQGRGLFPARKVYNNTMAASLAAIGKSWYKSIPIILGIWPWTYKYSIHLNRTGACINKTTGRENAETFFLLLYEVLRKKNTNYLDRFKAIAQINSAPCEGPYDYQYGTQNANNHAPGGWAATNRFHAEIWKQNGTVTNPDGGVDKFDFGNYTGLDYMLLYNLYHIRYGGIPYVNYNDRYLNDSIYLPNNYLAFNTIISSQKIASSTLPWVNYKASEQIELVPGFHAKEGSSFHAHIAPVGCGENFISDSTFVASTDTLTSEDSTTVFTIPCDSLNSYGVSDLDSVHFNGLDFDSAGTYNINYYWDFGTTGAVIPTPATSNIINPSVFFPCNNYYKIMLITSRDSTDSTMAETDTINFTLYKPCCGSSSFKKSAKKPEKEQLNSYNISVFPNPTNGIINVTCSNKSIVFSIEITDLLGNIIISDEGITDSKQYDLSSKPKGIYTLKAIGNDGTEFINKVLNQ